MASSRHPAGSDEPTPLWERAAAHGTLIIAVVGVLVYGMLVLAYSEFFQELGINPADVGIEYGKAIGGAAGLTLVAAVAAAVVSAVVGVLLELAAWLRRSDDKDLRKARRLAGERRQRWRKALAAGTLLTILVLLVGLHTIAGFYADRIKEGRRIEPVRLPLGVFDIELLAVRGDPAIVRATRPKLEDALGKLGPRVFYIGQSKGVAVLYNAHRQRVVYVPTAGIVLRTVNCETSRAKDFWRCEKTGS